MANLVNFPVTITGLVTLQLGTQNDMGQLWTYRRMPPQPFNVQGIDAPNRPVAGQIWPRGLPQQEA